MILFSTEYLKDVNSTINKQVKLLKKYQTFDVALDTEHGNIYIRAVCRDNKKISKLYGENTQLWEILRDFNMLKGEINGK